MEEAIHITRIANFKYCRKGRFQRIYWGVEFCQKLLPSIADTHKALLFAKKNNLPLTLVTPFITNSGLDALTKLFRFLKKEVYCEVVINDWGTLELLGNEFKGCFEPVLGRLLVRQQRDPTIKTVIEKQPTFAQRDPSGNLKIVVHRAPGPAFVKAMKTSYVNSLIGYRFIRGYSIKRIELNNLIQGYDYEPTALKKSIYTPYVNISTTRFCPVRTKSRKPCRIDGCKKECLDYYDLLRNKRLSAPIYMRGNTTFYKNPLRKDQALGHGVDRIVLQPEIPF